MRLVRAAFGAGLALGFAQAALAEVYAWRTEDGGYAYTDDRDQIPARYRAQAKRLTNRSLQSYERYTPQDREASARYADRLERRLAALRQVNAAAPPPPRDTGTATNAGTLMISTGNSDNAPQLAVPMQTSDEPVVIEEVTSKRTGDVRTRRSTVVRQGDKVVTVILGEPRIFDPNEFADEDALTAGSAD